MRLRREIIIQSARDVELRRSGGGLQGRTAAVSTKLRRGRTAKIRRTLAARLAKSWRWRQWIFKGMVGKQQRPRQSIEQLDHLLRGKFVVQGNNTTWRLGRPGRSSVSRKPIWKAASGGQGLLG